VRAIAAWVVALLVVIGAGVGIDAAVATPGYLTVDARNFYRNGLAPQFVELYSLRTTASSFVPGDPPGNIDDGDTTTFWAANTRVPITVRVPTVRVEKRLGPDGTKHEVVVHTFRRTHELSAPGVGATVKLNYNTTLPISAVSLIPGDQHPFSEFTKFGHPENVELLFSSGVPLFFTVPNSPSFFQETFFPPRTSAFVELKVLSTYAVPGPRQFDAITEFYAQEETG
jgi:hypothetical protein